MDADGELVRTEWDWRETECHLNARRIVAAPDLIAALEGLNQWNDETPCFCWEEDSPYQGHEARCRAATAALAKAKGLEENPK